MEKEKVKKLKKDLDKFLGDEEKELLKDVVEMLQKQDHTLSSVVKKIEASNLSKLQKKQFKELTEAVNAIKLELPDKLDVDVKNLNFYLENPFGLV